MDNKTTTNEAEVYVNNYMIADLVDYYNSDELELT